MSDPRDLFAGKTFATVKDLYDFLEQTPMFQKVAHYRLDENHNVVPCSMYEALNFQADEKARIVAQVDVTEEIRVSTVFFNGFMVPKDRPLRLFETMIFGGPRNGYSFRASTWAEAEENHRHAIAICQIS